MIEQKLLKGTFEKRFTLKYTIKAEVEKISKAIFYCPYSNLSADDCHYCSHFHNHFCF